MVAYFTAAHPSRRCPLFSGCRSCRTTSSSLSTHRNSAFSCSTSFSSKRSISLLIRNRTFHWPSSPWLTPIPAPLPQLVSRSFLVSVALPVSTHRCNVFSTMLTLSSSSARFYKERLTPFIGVSPPTRSSHSDNADSHVRLGFPLACTMCLPCFPQMPHHTANGSHLKPDYHDEQNAVDQHRGSEDGHVRLKQQRNEAMNPIDALNLVKPELSMFYVDSTA